MAATHASARLKRRLVRSGGDVIVAENAAGHQPLDATIIAGANVVTFEVHGS